jgi:4-amino-4-deoxy-L-arabinose transferase-like glycosyltransferase
MLTTPSMHCSRVGPTMLVVLLAGGQIVAWTLAPSLIHSAPPLDVLEGYLWGPQWVIGTLKHPALPSWVLETSRLLTGVIGWPAYLVAQLFVAATFIFAFLLGCDLMGAERSAAGTLLLAGVAYYAWPTTTFDHNIAQLPFWTGLPWALWRAVERRTIFWWLLVAVLAAGALFAKLSSALLLLSAAIWMVLDPRARRCLATPGPWIALSVFTVLVAPLGHWLVVTDYSALKYAALRAQRMPGDGVHVFLVNVLINLVGVAVMLMGAGLIGRRRSGSEIVAEPPQLPVDRQALRYLIVIAAAPLILAVVGALLTNSNLRSAWGSPMFGLIGLLAVALTSDRFNSTVLQRLAYQTATLLMIVPIGYALVIRFHVSPSRAPLRVNWPQSEIADRLTMVWARETGKPLRLVAGETWVAGLIALASKDKPLVMGHGDLAPLPAIDRSRLDAEGILIVWASPDARLPLSIMASSLGEERFRWRYSSGSGDLVIRYAIIPPPLPPD